MLSIKLKRKISKTVQKIRTKVLGRKILTFLISSIVVILIAMPLLVLYYSKDILIYSFSKERESSDNQILKLAEDAFRKGFLENSAIHYQSYLTNNPSKQNKITAYKRLFEINVLSGNYDAALINLKEMELLDTRDYSVFINRIKLLLRTDRMSGAKFEIDANYGKLKKSPEFLELTAVYHLKTANYETALSELLKIPPRRRSFSINMKIVHSYIKQNQISRAIAYLSKIEPRVRTFDDKNQKGEFILVKSLSHMIKGDYAYMTNNLKSGILTGSNRNMGYRLQIYAFIMQDNLNELTSLLKNHEIQSMKDPDLYSLIGNYYFYKGDYENALLYYEKMNDIREYTESELLSLTDIYYYAKKYEEAEKKLKYLNSEFGFNTPSYFKNMSKVKLSSGDFPSAYGYLKEGSQKYKDDLDFYIRLALINYEQEFSDNALYYINEGDRVSKLLFKETDKRFDILRLKLTDNSKLSFTELELLEMRNRPDADLKAYFRLIEFYVSNNRFFDAKRELDTVANLPRTAEQNNIFNIYKLIYAVNSNSYTEYAAVRESIISNDKIPVLYRILCLYLDGEYSKGISLSISYENSLSDKNKAEKIKMYYLRALLYYYSRDYVSCNIVLMQLFDIDPFNRKALYLKGLLNKVIQ